MGCSEPCLLPAQPACPSLLNASFGPRIAPGGLAFCLFCNPSRGLCSMCSIELIGPTLTASPSVTPPPSPLRQFQDSGASNEQAQHEAAGAAAERAAELEALEKELETALGQRQQLQVQLEEAEDKVGWLGACSGLAAPIWARPGGLRCALCRYRLVSWQSASPMRAGNRTQGCAAPVTSCVCAQHCAGLHRRR